MNWDSTLQLIIPIAVAIVSAIGSGSLVKVFVERKLARATAEKTVTEGEVARSQEDREWVRLERENATQRIDKAEKRMEAAEQKAEIAEEKVHQLERKIDELGDRLRDLQMRLRHCPGGDLCPMKP